MFTWEILQQGGRIEVYLNGGYNTGWDIDNPYHYKLLAKQLLLIEYHRQIVEKTVVEINLEDTDFIYNKSKTIK